MPSTIPPKLTKELADALCTVITVGFIDANKNASTVNNLLVTHTKVYAGITKFIYEKETDKSQHEEIKVLLGKYGVDVTFALQLPKPKCSIIIASDYSSSASDVADDFHKLLAAIEREANYEKIRALPGAYIGGLAKISASTIDLSGPSALYQYTPLYRDVGGDVETHYNNAKIVNNELIEILKKYCTGTKLSESKNTFAFRYASERKANETYKKDYLFASCHGMILAMNDFFSVPTGDIRFEIALGEDTCKVASCLPCSLFMTANGTPASATHLGRGDNWNFPKERCPDNLKTNWRYTVNKAYELGIPKVSVAPNVALLESYLGIDGRKGKIPEIFLEALTFEGSFMKRIENTLPDTPPTEPARRKTV